MKTVLVVFLLSVSAFAQDLSVAAAESACGPSNVQFAIKIDANGHQLEPPNPGKALVYVVEDQKFKVVNDVTTRVGMDGTWVGANRGNSYFSFSVEPGKHHLCADWISGFLPGGRLVALTSFTAESGAVYYLRVRTSASPTSGKAGAGASIDLDLVNEDEGRLLVASSGLSLSQQKD